MSDTYITMLQYKIDDATHVKYSSNTGSNLKDAEFQTNKLAELLIPNNVKEIIADTYKLGSEYIDVPIETYMNEKEVVIVYPPIDRAKMNTVYQCSECGFRIKPYECVGYVCGNLNCPMFPNVTC